MDAREINVSFRNYRIHLKTYSKIQTITSLGIKFDTISVILKFFKDKLIEIKEPSQLWKI